MNNNPVTNRIVWDCNDLKVSQLCIDGVYFEVTSFFRGNNKLSELLLAAAKAELSKSPKMDGAEGGELWYNQCGS